MTRPSPPDPIRRLPDGTVTEYITYVTPAGVPMAAAHRYRKPPPHPSTPPDPKMVMVGHVKYILKD